MLLLESYSNGMEIGSGFALECIIRVYGANVGRNVLDSPYKKLG